MILGVRASTGYEPFFWSTPLGFSKFTGTAYAGGCTSGHAIAGLADLQPASLLAVCGFFAGGLAGTYLILPIVLR